RRRGSSGGRGDGEQPGQCVLDAGVHGDRPVTARLEDAVLVRFVQADEYLGDARGEAGPDERVPPALAGDGDDLQLAAEQPAEDARDLPLGVDGGVEVDRLVVLRRVQQRMCDGRADVPGGDGRLRYV